MSLAVLPLALAACGSDESDDDRQAYLEPVEGEPEVSAGDTLVAYPSWTREDWEIFQSTMAWAEQNDVAALPIGERIATLGQRFVGAPYVPKTLDPDGPERLIVNLRVYDCVTFVENMLAMAHWLERAPEGVMRQPSRAIGLYEDILTRIRYRSGTMNGYTSRLHYFTDWFQDAEDKGLVSVIAQDLGGGADPEPIDFMTTHRESYQQLATDDAMLAEIADAEARLSGRTRYYIPQRAVAGVADRIQTGDIIAATSTIRGLDIAHTGIALRTDDGVLRLMHAPLIGKDVQISERPLADRLLAIEGQDGIVVARPLPVR